MSTLHERLADLATDAPASAPDPLLWDRVARFHRRRRAGSAGILAVTVVLVGVLTGLVVRQAEMPVRPAAAGATLALPTLIARPSPWLPGTDGNPIGPLAALVPAERSSLLGSSWGVVGISATTGEYRFLDLPNDAGHDWAMSPDGGQVAYWTTGETRLSPHTSGGQERPVTGVGMYDTADGTVVRHEFDTDHGITTDEGLWWVDAETLAFSFGQHRGGDADSLNDQASSSFPDALYLWDVEKPGPVRTDLPLVSIQATNGRGSLLADREVLDVGTGALRRLDYGPSISRESSVALDPTGSVVAFPQGSRNPAPLAIADADSRGSTVVDEVVRQAVAWIDEDHVAYLLPAGGVQPRGFLESVDLVTGERVRVLTYQGYSISPGHLANDLLAEPTVERERPAQPISPRVLLGWSIAALVIGGYAVWLWRRRVRP